MSSSWHAPARVALRLERRQALAVIALMAVTGISTVRGYISAYPSATSRAVLAASLGGNAGFQALYGVARRIDTLGGFTAWRITWMLSAIAAVWGLLAATRLARGEEESGRRELLLAGPTTSARLLVVDAATVIVAMALFVAVFTVSLTASGVPARGALVIATGIGAAGCVFAALGLFLSQLYTDRRRASGVGGAALGTAFLLRVAADGTATLGWMRWLTPFGWVENLRPFAGTNLAPLLLLALATAGLVGAAFVALARRDFGTGLVTTEARGRPESRLLRGVGGFTMKLERGAVIAWAVAIGAFAFVFGVLSEDAARFARSQRNLNEMLARLGVASLARPANFLGLAFTFFALPIALFAATQVNAARTEESSSRVDIVLVQPVSRRRWLAIRVAVTSAGAVLMGVAGGVLAWFGASLRHAGVPFGTMLRAGINSLPAVFLLFGIAVFCFGVAPRLTSAVSLGSVVIAYLLELVGALLRAPAWILDVSPFHHLAPVPAAPAKVGAAFVMIVVGAIAAAGGIEAFAHRDLVGA